MTVRAMMCFIVFLPSLAAQHQSRLKVDIDATGELSNKKPIVRSQKFAKWKGDALEPNTEVAAILADSMPKGPKVIHDKAAHGTPRKQIPASKAQIPAAQADAEGPTLAVLSAETSTARVTGAFQKKDSAKQSLVDARGQPKRERTVMQQAGRPEDGLHQTEHAGRLLQCVEERLSGKVPDCEQFALNAQLKLAAVLEQYRESLAQELYSSSVIKQADKLQSNSGIAVVSVCHGQANYADVCAAARRNMKAYCKRHGYDLLFHDQPLSGLGKHPAGMWEKILAIQDAFTKAKITSVWWQDADSLFMNMSQPLDVLAPRNGKDLTASGDGNCFINTGHLMLRRSQWSSQLLHDAWMLDPPVGPDMWGEQPALIYLLSGKKAKCRQDSRPCCGTADLDHHVDFRPQMQMNTYAGSYSPGDFIIHFAGAKPSEKASLMNEYGSQAEFAASTKNQQWLAAFHTAITEGVASLVGTKV